MLSVGVAFALAGALCLAVKDFFSKKALKQCGEWDANFYIGLATFIISSAYVLFTGIPKISQPTLFYGAIAGAGLSFGTYFFFKALKEERASVIGPLASLWAVVAMIVAAFLFSTPISLGTIVGAILSFGAIAMISLMQHPRITASILLAVLIWGTAAFNAPVVEEAGAMGAIWIVSFFLTLFSLPGIRAKNPVPLAKLGVVNFVAQFFFISSIPLLNVAVASSLLMSSYFVFMVLGGALFFNEKISRKEAVLLAVVCLGIVIASAFR